MKKFFTLLLAFYPLLCHCQDTIFLDSKWNTTNRLNAEFFRIDSKEGNKWIRHDYYYSSKRLQMMGTYSSLNPDIENGYFERYFANGRIKQKGNYANGKKIGEHLWYNEDGGLEAKENYIDDKLNGEYEEYHPNGKLMIKTSFLDGLQNGWTEYFREDGTKQSEGKFKNQKRDGLWKFFDTNGQVSDTTVFKTEFEIPEANLYLELPTDEWSLNSYSNKGLIQYIFKREEVLDSLGRTIIPAIMLYIEDATSFKQDVVLYSINKRMMFKNAGLKVDSILGPYKPNYPIPFKNSLITLTPYSAKGFDHILFMTHIINKDNKGIQIYMDMTKEIAPKYEQEFWKTLSSIRELKK